MMGQMICAFGADDVGGRRLDVQKTTFSDDRQHPAFLGPLAAVFLAV